MPTKNSVNFWRLNSIYEVCYPLFRRKTLIKFPCLAMGELQFHFNLLYRLSLTIMSKGRPWNKSWSSDIDRHEASSVWRKFFTFSHNDRRWIIGKREKESWNSFFLLFNHLKNFSLKFSIFTEHLKHATFHTRKCSLKRNRKSNFFKTTLFKEAAVYKIDALKIFEKLTWKHLCWHSGGSDTGIFRRILRDF